MRVLVVFSDTSLGGTGRSAFAAARAWKAAGAETFICSPESSHASRRSAIEALGVTSLPWAEGLSRQFDIVHIHHGAASARMTEWVNKAVRAHFESIVIANNIFASPMNYARHPRLVISTLGVWAERQLILSSPTLRLQRSVVMPNAQDEDFFRPPSRTERESARRRLEIQQEKKVLLRVGSPLTEKWSKNYLKIGQALEDKGLYSNVELVLLGPPPELARQLADHVRVVNRVADDETLRDWYWSADLFAHDAQRGESFGNVIWESLNCGTPVLYRNRPFRDNTPFELSGLPLFEVCRSSRSWRRRALQFHTAERDLGTAATRQALEPYSITATADRYRKILWRCEKEDARNVDWPISDLRRIAAFPRLQRLPAWSWATIALRHNPAASKAKAIRHSMRRSLSSADAGS